MKYILTPLLLILAIHSVCQDCTTSALMKPGTRLTYQAYLPKMELFKKKPSFYKTTKMVLTVSDVADSAGGTTAHLLKEGASFNDPERDHYKKEISLFCNGKALMLPIDLFLPDTMYISDAYPTKRQLGYSTAQVPLTATISLAIPIGKVEGELAASSKSMRMLVTNRLYNMNDQMMLADQKRRNLPETVGDDRSNFSKREDEVEMSVRSVSIAGKETITTPAGTFNCYKIIVLGSINVMKMNRPYNYALFYDPAVGCVRLEIQGGSAAYIELESASAP